MKSYYRKKSPIRKVMLIAQVAKRGQLVTYSRYGFDYDCGDEWDFENDDYEEDDIDEWYSDDDDWDYGEDEPYWDDDEAPYAVPYNSSDSELPF